MEVITAQEIGKYIPDDATVAIEGFIGSGVADSVHQSIREYFNQTKHPQHLTLIHAAGIGDADTKGMNYYNHPQLVQRVIGGHWAMAPKLQPLVEQNLIEAYNFPQGVISHLLREASAGKEIMLSKVGLGTFVDPDLQGGKLNQKTTEDLVQKVEVLGETYLAYQVPKIDIAILRGTYADQNGNISFEHEALTLEATSMAIAAHNNGGKVIVQVKKIVDNGTLDPKKVKIPGLLVDYVVESIADEHQGQTYGIKHNDQLFTPGLAEHVAFDLPLNQRSLIGQLCLQFIPSYAKVVNYGIGMPEMVAQVIKADYPKLDAKLTPTIEPGTVGGAPLSGMDFGTSLYPEATIDQSYMFDLYDGGGIDIAFLGLAECDRFGNINVSKFGAKIAGAGGFINISQNTKHIVFCGTFTAGGLQTTIADGTLRIQKEGQKQKFVQQVEQITFNGRLALERQQIVHYVTERAIFTLTEQGLCLTQIAPGIDLERDILAQMAFKPLIADKLQVMDQKYFQKKGL